MKIVILGAAGFIGTNLTFGLLEDKENEITLVDRERRFFHRNILKRESGNIQIIERVIDGNTDFEVLVRNQEIVYHLVSTTVPTTSNLHIPAELNSNIVMTAKLLEACVSQNVKKIVFLSSGGTVYGKVAECPISEETQQYPISAYGLQKVTIEKLLYLYNYLYGLDYRIIRLSNPYGPHQNPNGIQGVITTFVYNALHGKPVIVYGDGEVVRDFIYIDDAIRGIVAIANAKESTHKTFNLGSGYGISVNQVINTIEKVLDTIPDIQYKAGRQVDVPENYLDISLFKEEIGFWKFIDLACGIKLTADFMRIEYE